MLRLLLLSVFLLSIISCNPSSEEKITTDKIGKTPHDIMFMQRAYPTGELNTAAYAEAIQWKKQLAQRGGTAVLWEFAGPTNVGGRITDIEIPIDQAETYYVGAASGGIFKTTDAGATWNPIFDEQSMLSIGDMEISKNDTAIIWVGTGEVNAGGGSLAYDGNGMFKSDDGGISWAAKGLENVGSIGKVLIDPNDENTLIVGAMGPLFRNDVNRGVYKTTDGGTSWEQKLFVSDSTGIIDMAMHPSNGDIVYAASWERIRRPNNRQYGGVTSGLYRSTDGGETWAELNNGLPPTTAAKGRISIDISQSNPNVLYTRYLDANGSISGVYRTADGGDSWIQMNSSQLNNVGFHWWFRGIYVDPTDEDVIYNVDFVVQKSIDGGANWSTAFPGVHVDQHALAFNTQAQNEVLLGNDGGLYKSTNNGSASVKIDNLPITQFYRIHIDAQNDQKRYGGSQDNSTIRTTTGGMADWNTIYGGDGFQPLVDHANTNVIYALSQNGNLGKSVNNGNGFSGATNGIPSGDRNNWDTAIAMDPANSQILYYGTQRLFQTTNAAGVWNAISPDLSDGPHTGNLSYGTITSIDVSTLDSNMIYVGTDDGNVWVTLDGGNNWNNISSTLPNRWVTKVFASRDELNTVYVTYSGYRYGEDTGHVYKSSDNGSNWIDISTGLPDIPVNDILEDSFGNLFIGTDIGVLGTTDEGNNWQVIGENLPSVVVNDMHIHEASEYLYIGTYGRSIYKLDISEDVLSVANSDLAETISMYPNPASELVNLAIGDLTGDLQVSFYDQLGRKISSELFSEDKNNLQFSLQSMQSGVYFVHISNGNSRTVKKLIVKK
ncbi:T9SS type A sorting domain-containing protein [Ulvibacter antarcticus]|uniref:Putative secreted protein (Por secretion system target) n=1 Tax=Ulvibacter antarcticus TaxID=442714 RepID=A0A3L9YDN6_9FLAO|nr:T9SS type A sorting domain-containing protein [Ulvibacter antarcticus]RMA57149.1 putative secreted protein (Por secretion system target) [Ulvibacter antarcticus]